MPATTTYLAALAAALAIVILFLILGPSADFLTKSLAKPSSTYTQIINFSTLNVNTINFSEQLYDMTSTIPSFTGGVDYNGTTGNLSQFSVNKVGDYAEHIVKADVISKTAALSVAIIPLQHVVPVHELIFSSTFSFDFNASFYENSVSQTFPFSLDYQFGPLGSDQQFIFADRDILCFNSTTNQHAVRYQYQDLQSSLGLPTVYDTGCTIPLGSEQSFLSHCMYPNRCTEENDLNYNTSLATIIYRDENETVFFSASMSFKNPGFPQYSNTINGFAVANENFCADAACQTFKEYLYNLSITTR